MQQNTGKFSHNVTLVIVKKNVTLAFKMTRELIMIILLTYLWPTFPVLSLNTFQLPTPITCNHLTLIFLSFSRHFNHFQFIWHFKCCQWTHLQCFTLSPALPFQLKFELLSPLTCQLTFQLLLSHIFSLHCSNQTSTNCFHNLQSDSLEFQRFTLQLILQTPLVFQFHL